MPKCIHPDLFPPIFRKKRHSDWLSDLGRMLRVYNPNSLRIHRDTHPDISSHMGTDLGLNRAPINKQPYNPSFRRSCSNIIGTNSKRGLHTKIRGYGVPLCRAILAFKLWYAKMWKAEDSMRYFDYCNF